MKRNQARTSHDEARRVAGSPGTRGLIFWAISFCIGLLIWFTMRSFSADRHFNALELAALGVLSAILTLSLERSLQYIPLARSKQYRLAFLGGIGLIVIFGAALWIGSALGGAAATSADWGSAALGGIAMLLAVGLGAFIGCLTATGIHERLWENNSPPPPETQAEVYAIHRAVIGAEESRRPTSRLFRAGSGSLTKRAFDLVLAATGLLISAPVWCLSIFLIWFEDPGPVLFVKNSVGKGGVNFFQLKLRTMVREAEQEIGPVLAQEGDERILAVGGLLRKTALDELPQLINILRGEMSFVGPRPQRTVLVHGYLKSMPEYAERHRVQPGLAGLAQVAGDYYLTPRQKLRFDRLYIRHISLGFDLKLLLCAFLIAFWYRWQRDWDGRVPRKLFRFGARQSQRTIS